MLRRLYFHPNGKLSFDPPPANSGAAFDTYVSDPARPVPYRPRPIEVRSGWTTWLVQDQRFVHHRPDVLTWVTDTLDEDVVVSGKIIANLFASTSGTDSDWIVKLIDVYPDKYEPDPKMGGYQLMIAGDVFRGRYYKSWEKPHALPAFITRRSPKLVFHMEPRPTPRPSRRAEIASILAQTFFPPAFCFTKCSPVAGRFAAAPPSKCAMRC